jgi:AcrR family transcriptional regulator
MHELSHAPCRVRYGGRHVEPQLSSPPEAFGPPVCIRYRNLLGRVTQSGVLSRGIVIDMADVDPGSRSFTVKGRATRERIISCATELVLRDGFAALSMENVRKAASVSGSQITHYFTDKDSLVRAIVSRQTQALHDFHRQSALRGLDTFEDLDRWAELTLKIGRRRKRRSALPTCAGLAGDVTTLDNETHRLLADGYRQCVELLAGGLQRMKDRGQLIDDANPEQLAYLLLSAHQGADIRALDRPRRWPDADALDFALSYVRLFAAKAGDRPPRTSGRADTPKRRAKKRV